MICNKCGAQNDDTRTACMFCGNKLIGNSVPLMQQMSANGQQVVKPDNNNPSFVLSYDENRTIYIDDSVQQIPVVTPPPAQQQKSSNKGLIIGLSVGLSTLLIIAIAVTLVLVLSNRTPKVEPTTALTTVVTEAPYEIRTDLDFYTIDCNETEIVIGKTTYQDLINLGFKLTVDSDENIEAHKFMYNVNVQGKNCNFYASFCNDTDEDMPIKDCTMGEVWVKKAFTPNKEENDFKNNMSFFRGVNLQMSRDELAEIYSDLPYEKSSDTNKKETTYHYVYESDKLINTIDYTYQKDSDDYSIEIHFKDNDWFINTVYVEQ